MKYLVTIGTRTFEVEVADGRVRLDGREVDAVLQPLPGGVERMLTLPTARQTFAMTRVEGGWELNRAGEVIRAQVLDERAHAIRALAHRGHGPGGTHQVRAPMPGLVVRLETEVGARVRAGQGVVVLEAMKMENELATGVAGTVTAVRATPGQAVDKGSILVEVSAEG